MKPQSSVRFLFVLSALLIAGGTGFAVQWHQSTLLRRELDHTRSAADVAQRLQDENRRLKEKQIPASELARLRADHAALPRLRAELDALARPAAPSAGR